MFGPKNVMEGAWFGGMQALFDGTRPRQPDR